MEGISWDEASLFCERSSWLRLPTEAEWEYACRGGVGTRFAFGPRLARGDAVCLPEADEAVASGPLSTAEVDTLRANGYGLHHVHGNVWEWCLDSFAPDFPSRPGAAGKDPVCRDDVEMRAVRGGSAELEPMYCAAGFRFTFQRYQRHALIGLRPVYPLE